MKYKWTREQREIGDVTKATRIKKWHWSEHMQERDQKVDKKWNNEYIKDKEK